MRGTLRNVRLIRKLALSLNGFDLSAASVGQILSVSEPEAAMLIAEGWAEPAHESPAPSKDRRRSIPPEQQ
jgi:hypothetical protein